MKFFADVATVETADGFRILLIYNDGERFLSYKTYETREKAEAAAQKWVLENLDTDQTKQ